MSAYGFKARWEEPLRRDAKLTTLRKERKDGRAPRVGEKFSAFVGMRTPHCRRLFDSTISEVTRVRINAVLGESEFEPVNYAILCDGRMLNEAEGERFAREDGFESLEKFIAFFEEEHAIQTTGFIGYLIRWAQPVAWA